jgi:hemolysin III
VKRFVLVSTLLYIAMGWLIVLAWDPLASSLAGPGLNLLVVGGVLYTIGSIFYVWRGFPYHHAIWHIFVLGGTITHYLAILLYVLPH